MHRIFLAGAALSMLGIAACKQSETSVSNNQTQGVVEEPGVEDLSGGNMLDGNMAGMPAGADQAYVQNAAMSDMFEIETSRLALEKAAKPSVKTYAQMMIDEHGKSSAELKAAAQAAGLTVPAALPADKQAKVDALRGLSGDAFDGQYLADQRSGHQETLAKVNAYLASAPAGPLKDHAGKVTGVVQKHLNSLEKIK